MPRKKTKKISDLLDNMKDDIILDSNIGNTKYIPDIITFCESDDYLGLTSKKIELRPFQRITLKAFYRGSAGNEHLSLTEEEIELCKEHGMDTEEKGGLLNKYFTKDIFRELVLVWGRRSGKDFLSSIIALYEALRLLECEGGDPYAIYNLSSAAPICILTIATAKDQATTAFNEIKDKVIGSKYFIDKIGRDGLEANKICLLTPKDRLDNKILKDNNLPPSKGSIHIEVGHSNSDSLLGKGVFVLLLDEVASYKRTGGSSSGERIYTAMSPALATYGRDVVMTDEQGKIVYDESGSPRMEHIYDSKIISISSPRGEDGIFYDLFQNSSQVRSRLSCKLPTWVVSPSLTEESLRRDNSHMTEEQFMMEFGAEFSGTGGESFFPRQDVDDAFDMRISFRNTGEPGRVYFAHLDPATSSHNYALAIVHKEMFYNEAAKQNDFKIKVDHIKFWHPTAGQPIKVEEVDDYVINLKKRFYFGMVTYDQWDSARSILKMRSKGIPSKLTRFTNKYKMSIYSELYNLVISNRIIIPPHSFLKSEMTNLQRKFLHPSGWKVYPKREGEINTDDLVDALAGATYNAIKSSVQHLPTGRLVTVGNSTNNITWKSMSGPIGTGNGQQVAKALEMRQAWKLKR
jgi:hypothetical protein